MSDNPVEHADLDEHAQYARDLIAARIPEFRVEELLALGGAAPLSYQIADMVLDVLDAFEDRMAELEQAVRKD